MEEMWRDWRCGHFAVILRIHGFFQLFLLFCNQVHAGHAGGHHSESVGLMVKVNMVNNSKHGKYKKRCVFVT